MEFRESELPGIGKKFTIKTQQGAVISVVLHVTGKREIFIFEEGEEYEDPDCDVILTEDEAKQLGSVLMGTYFRPEQEREREIFLRNLAIEWVKVESNSPLVGKSIEELGIRKRTGVTVISIVRGEHTITNPLPEEVIREGDTLILVGTREQMDRFFREFKINA